MEATVPEEILRESTDAIVQRARLIENEVRELRREEERLRREIHSLNERVKENEEKIKLNAQLPFLVANVVEVLPPAALKRPSPTTSMQLTHNGSSSRSTSAPLQNRGLSERHLNGANGLSSAGSDETHVDENEDDADDEGAAQESDANRQTHAVVVKTSTRQTVYLPIPGLVDVSLLRPGDLVGVNKDSYLILEKLPEEYDARVKAFEVDERPTEDFADIGGLDKQIEEVIEAVVLPMTHKHLFERVGIRPPKGVLMYGPPGTGKTLLARACAAQTKATFLKLAGTSLVQMYIGDGARLVRDAFALAKKKAPSIIFIDELDAIGTKRFDSDRSGDRETQRTMLELLNQLDGFDQNDDVRVLAATNRPDILDAALMRSGRLDRKIEFPHPDEAARARILRIHSRKMNVHPDVSYEELARSTDDFNAAMLKAVCVEAGMAALRADRKMVIHEDFIDGIAAVQAKKKMSLNYYA
ncbi:26S proteasome regulatory subunit 6A [Cyanidiococcus yangmingshanensis]|uniref:26S proteasome regulatory subunit 6A n=1 Tax=Cyanidiococcus yangmingshanensis TaxID=2690220 RepID=A0A7J7IQJ6_9RHOD|nr:26S proteasome regulatory subunit 6A [Cyanidiococcus yangmingshanensis]